MENPLPPIPPKRYFTIGEVSELCRVKPYVLRYWEQEFTQLKPMKRRGNRRYYQHHEVLLIRRIRDLLYEQGFTISGARNRLGDVIAPKAPAEEGADEVALLEDAAVGQRTAAAWSGVTAEAAAVTVSWRDRPASAADARADAAQPLSAAYLPTTLPAGVHTATVPDAATPAAPLAWDEFRRELLALRRLLDA
jgi:DNA-binding transcriptional MerR regulator